MAQSFYNKNNLLPGDECIPQIRIVLRYTTQLSYSTESYWDCSYIKVVCFTILLIHCTNFHYQPAHSSACPITPVT